MAYSQHEWVNGEIITAEKLNNMEQGISDCGARAIAASAAATVENTAGEPSCEVTATGSVASIAFNFAFKGIKGETGEQGIQGETGTTPLLQKGETAIQVSLDNGESWSDLVALDDIKGEKGEQGEAAPTVVSQEINITGTVISGTTWYSDGSKSPIAGVYAADSGEEDGGGEGETESGDGGGGGNEENPDEGDDK